MTLRDIAFRRPIGAAVLCAAAQFFLTILILQAGMRYLPPDAFGKVKLAAFASTVILPLVLVQVLGLWRQVGFDIDRLRPAPVFLVSLLSGALFLVLGVHAQARPGFGAEAGLQFVNAFGEELLFRGVIFALLLSLPRWQGILLSGILFGAMHLIHGVMDGNWEGAMWQSAITAMAGMMFAAVRYATGSLWLAILLHMILNLCIIYTNVEIAAGPEAMLVVKRLANVFEVALALWVIVKGRAMASTAAGGQAGQRPRTS